MERDTTSKYCGTNSSGKSADAEADEDEIDSPVEVVHETKLIEGGEHEPYPFDRKESDCLDLVICDEEDVDAWAHGEVDDEDDHGRYALLLINWDDELTEVTSMRRSGAV